MKQYSGDKHRKRIELTESEAVCLIHNLSGQLAFWPEINSFELYNKEDNTYLVIALESTPTNRKSKCKP